MDTYNNILKIKEEAEAILLKIPGVTGVEVARKKKGDQLLEELSIVVYVEQKRPLDTIPSDQRIPAEINGVKTDIVETGGPIRVLGPYTGGTDVQCEHGGLGGTLGCFAFTTENSPRAVLLTNQHVVMQGQNVTPKSGEVGPLVCSICSPCCSKIIADLHDIVLTPLVDGAIALIRPTVQLLREVTDIGPLKGSHPISAAEAQPQTYPVKMYSRMQGEIVTGTVHSITWSGPISLHNNELHRNATNQISIHSTSAFAKSGDSGSVLLNNNNEVVGLVCAANEAGTVSIACLIENVKSALHIDIPVINQAGQIFTVPAAPANPNKGAVVSVQQPLMGGISMNTGTDALKQVYKKLLETETGSAYEALYRKHMEEVRYLVNHNKRVATVWHRHHGPAFLGHFSNSIMTPSYVIPETVKNVTLTALLENMADILTKYGSSELQTDLALHVPQILVYAAGCSSVENLIAQFNSQHIWPMPQEH